MSMFERLGEKVERFKQEAVSARDESAAYRCRNCNTEIYTDQEECPECGSSDIERVEDPETTAETTEGDGDAEPDETVAAEEADITEDTAETEDAEPNALIEEAEDDETDET